MGPPLEPINNAFPTTRTPRLSQRLSAAQSFMKLAFDDDLAEEVETEGEIVISNRINTNKDIYCVSYTETFDAIAAGINDGSIRLFKANDGDYLGALRDAEVIQNPAPVTAIKHRPVQKTQPITNTVTATYAAGYVKCWHHTSGQCVYTIREKRQTLGLAYHPHLAKFLTVGNDCNVYMYDEETKIKERVFSASGTPNRVTGHKSRVFCACFNPKSAFELISGGWDDTIQFWDTRQPHSLRYIEGVHICGEGLDISKNGREIVTAAWQPKNALQLWDYSSGKLIVTLESGGHKSHLYCGRFLDNHSIVCGGTNANVFCIVDLRSHSASAAITKMPGGVYGLDIGSMTAKRHRRPKVDGSHPKLLFCAGKSIYEVEPNY